MLGIIYELNRFMELQKIQLKCKFGLLFQYMFWSKTIWNQSEFFNF